MGIYDARNAKGSLRSTLLHADLELETALYTATWAESFYFTAFMAFMAAV
jgi:hypothetical protein